MAAARAREDPAPGTGLRREGAHCAQPGVLPAPKPKNQPTHARLRARRARRMARGAAARPEAATRAHKDLTPCIPAILISLLKDGLTSPLKGMLRLGDTLKPTATGFDLDLSRPDQHKTSATFGLEAAERATVDQAGQGRVHLRTPACRSRPRSCARPSSPSCARGTTRTPRSSRPHSPCGTRPRRRGGQPTTRSARSG